MALRRSWPRVLQILQLLREQGLVLAALLGLSAFFYMAETSITTLWPWKVRELAEKEPENGVFKMLRSDVTRFLTTILIGTTVVNIGATAIVTEAATAMFGEAGVSAATGVMTVAVLLTEITPKSVAVHNATEVARFVVRPVAWLSLILYPVGRIVTFLSMGMLKILGLKGRRGQLHYKSNILGKNMTKPKLRLLNRNVSSVSRRSSQDCAEGSSDEETDAESSKTRKRAPSCGRRKSTVHTSEGETQEAQMNTEGASPEEAKKMKRRGRKKAAIARSGEEKENIEEPKKRGRRKVMTVEELSDDEGEDQSKDMVSSNQREDQIEGHVSVNDLESKVEALLLEDIGELDSLMPLVCCFGPAKYSFIPYGRPANRLIDHEIHNRMKDMFWSPDEFVRAPGGPSSNVALALAAIGGRVAFMGKLGDDEHGQSLLYHLNINGVQTRAVSLDPSAPTAMSLMKVTGRGSLETTCVKPCAEDCFLQSDINPAVLKEAKMFYYNSSALLERTTRSSLLKAIEISKKFGGIIFFDLNLPLPLWSSSKETKSLIKEAWEAADIIEVTKQELEFLCGIKPSEKLDTEDNDKSKFTHYSAEVVMKLWHDNLEVLFVTNGTSKIHYYTKKHNGWVCGMEDAPITPFTGDMSQSGDAIVAALMSMMAINPHHVTDKVYLHKAIKHAIKCGVIDQWLLARERGFLPKERADPANEQYEVRSITERDYRTLPDAVQPLN